MTISEAIRAVDEEYSEECLKAQKNPEFNRMMTEVIGREYDDLDKELPHYVSEIARACGVRRHVEPYVYQIARMCFRLGMRVQRKLDQPDRPTTSDFWAKTSKTH